MVKPWSTCMPGSPITWVKVSATEKWRKIGPQKSTNGTFFSYWQFGDNFDTLKETSWILLVRVFLHRDASNSGFKPRNLGAFIPDLQLRELTTAFFFRQKSGRMANERHRGHYCIFVVFHCLEHFAELSLLLFSRSAKLVLVDIEGNP